MSYNEKILRILEGEFWNTNFEKQIDKEVGEELNSIINDIWSKLPTENIAILGAGLGLDSLFDIVNKDEKDIVCIIDRYEYGKKRWGFNVIGYENVNKYKNINTILITSSGYEYEMKMQIEEYIPNAKVILLYEEIRKRGYDIKDTIYHEGYIESYKKINYILLKFKNNRNEKCLRSLIYNYIKIRDFKNALYYMNYYLDNGYENDCIIKKIHKNIVEIINKIKKELSEFVKSKSVNLFIICDALRYRDVFENKNMKYIKEKAKQGIIINNAFTHVPYTTGSLLSIFTGRKLLETGLFSEKRISCEEELLKNIEKNNYIFKYFGCRSRMFDDKYKEENSNNNASMIFWKSICNILEEKNKEKDVLYCLHLSESHSPYCSGEHTGKFIKFDSFSRVKIDSNIIPIEERQHNESIKYLDEQIEYFTEIFTDLNIILTSDHGTIIEADNKKEDRSFFCDDFVHIPYIIWGKNYNENKEIESLFSHLDTHKLLINLINNNYLFDNIEERDYVEIERDWTYSKTDLEKLNKLNELKQGKAFKCISDKSYKYVLYFDGNEEFYELPNENTNLIQNKEYEEQIQKFREKVNCKFPDWEKEEKYSEVKKYFCKQI